jgi:chromosome segregation ATPase
MSPTCAPSPSVDTLVSELLRKNATLQDELDEVKEVSNLNQSTLQIVAKDLESKDQECAELRHSVHTLKADLELSKKGRGGELAVLQAQLHDITVSREALVLERDHHNKQMASLRQENDILANRATIAEDAVSRYMTYVNILKQQYQTLSSFFTGGQQTPKQPFYAEEMQ